MTPLEQFLLARGDPPPPDVLRRAGLAAYAFGALPNEHPARAALRPDYLASLARHHALRAEMDPLLAAWRAAGVDALVYKGFDLAERVYPAPGMRFHGDVDVAVRPGHEDRAAAVAASLGWTEDRPPGSHPHSASTLQRDGGATAVDLHRLVVQARRAAAPLQRRITDAVWARARLETRGEGAAYAMDPVDAAVVGVILERCWGGDRWHLKPHDPIDLRLLAERAGVTRDGLRARARELGCARTVDLYLRRCDPWRGVLDTRRPTTRERLAWDARAFPERGPLGALEQIVARPRRAVEVAGAVASVLPLVTRAWWLGRRRPIPVLLDAFTPPPRGGAPSTTRRARVVLGVRWAVRLFVPESTTGPCVVRSLALHAALRRDGWPTTFVSGVRVDAGRVIGHAWVELDGAVLPELEEPGNRVRFAVNVEHPRPLA